MWYEVSPVREASFVMRKGHLRVRDEFCPLRNPIMAMQTALFTGPKLILYVPDAVSALLRYC